MAMRKKKKKGRRRDHFGGECSRRWKRLGGRGSSVVMRVIEMKEMVIRVVFSFRPGAKKKKKSRR